jgi:hypothetical protein
MRQKEDLGEAIQLHRDSLLLYPLGNPDRSSSLHNLTNGLQTSLSRRKVWRNPNEALNQYEEALFLRPPGHPERSNSLSSLPSSVKSTLRKWVKGGS